MMRSILVLCVCLLLTQTSWSQTSTVNLKNEQFVLPKPSGKYGVGRYWTYLTDTARQNREISLFLYYPIKAGNTSAFTVPTEEWRMQYLPVLQKKLGDSAGKALAFGKAYFSAEAGFSTKEKYPLVLFSPGMGWSTLEYTYILQELASAGYIVAAVNSSPLAPVLQSPTGRFVLEQDSSDRYQLVANDLLFVLQQFKDRNSRLDLVAKNIDWKNLGVSGHSVGGAAALLASHYDPTFKAAVNMDGDMLGNSLKATPHGSVLFLNQMPAAFENSTFDQLKSDTDRGWRYQQMVKATANASEGMYLSIAGMYHSNFQDYALLPAEMIPENIRKFRLGPLEGSKCLRLISEVLITYFDDTLKGRKAKWKKLEQEHSSLRLISLKP